MIKRFLLVLILTFLVITACNTDSVPVVVGTPAIALPTATINPIFLQREATVAPPTAVPTIVPTATIEPTATPDPLAASAEYQNSTLGIAFTYPLDWVVESTSETQLLAGLGATVSTSRAISQTKPAQLLLSISTIQSNGSNPLTLLSETEPAGQIDFTVFPESIAAKTGKAAHSSSTVTHPGSGAIYQSERFIFVVADDAYLLEFSQSTESAEINAPLINRIIDSLGLTGVDRAAIAGSILQEQEAVDGGEILIDQIVTGTISSGVNYLIGLGTQDSYLIASIANKADLVITIASNLNPDIPLLTIDNSFAAQPEAIVWSPPQDGGYIVNIRDFAFVGGEYALTIQSVDPETNVLPPITATLGQIPLIYIEPIAAFNPEFKLVNDQNIPILFVDAHGSSEAEIAMPSDLVTGTYTIALGAAQGVANDFISTVTYVPDTFFLPRLLEEFRVAKPLATNTITNGVTGAQTHYITVASNLPHVLIANANRDADTIIRIRNLDGSERLRIDDFSTGEIESRVVNLPVGSYILDVIDWRNNFEHFDYVVGFFEFFPSGTDSVEIDLRPEADAVVIAQPNDNFDVVLTAQDVNYNQIAERDSGFNGIPELFILQAGRSVPKGIYVAHIAGFDGTIGIAQLGVIYVHQAFLDIGNR